VATFVAAQRVEHQIPHAMACRALGVSPAWFYKWVHGDASPRRARRAQLAVACLNRPPPPRPESGTEKLGRPANPRYPATATSSKS
jgi:hypothetical protein